MNFSLPDWIILAAYIALIFYVGVRGKKYVSDSEDFLVAGRSMGLYVGMISLVATEIGIITYMYYAEMGVMYGFTACVAGVVTASVYVIVGKTGFVIKRFRELELVTIPHFFEDKYGSDVRVLVGVLMAVGGALNFGVFPIIEEETLAETRWESLPTSTKRTSLSSPSCQERTSDCKAASMSKQERTQFAKRLGRPRPPKRQKSMESNL